MPGRFDRRNALRAATAAALLATAPATAFAWGFEGHRMVNAHAAAALPDPLRILFEANADYLAEHSVDPDLWRAAGLAGEQPNHFLDMDAFGSPPFPGVPADEAEHLRRHGPEAMEKGRVPWRVAEGYRALVEAFARGDSAEALRRAAILGHYVSDAHVPLHAAVNYDGQLSGQTGLHSRWESSLISRFRQQLEPRIHPGPVTPLREPVELTLATLRESFAEVDAVLAADLASIEGVDVAATAADDRYDDAYYSRLFEAEAPRLERRLSLAAERLAGLWLGAWQEAGRPTLPPFRFAHVRGRRRGVLLSLDGAGEPLLRDAVARGVMPTLARLRAEGATASGMISTEPAQTAVGHAALFTGAWPEHNGITANTLLPPGAAITATDSGYSSRYLRAEPLWATAARQGLDATVASATQVDPFDPYLQERRFGADFGRRLTLLAGYPRGEWPDSRVVDESALSPRVDGAWDDDAPVAGARALRVELGGDLSIEGLVYDDPGDPVAGYDSLLLAPERRSDRGVVLKPLPPGDVLGLQSLAAILDGEPVVTHLRLFELAPDASRLRLWVSPPYPLYAHPAAAAPPALDATRGFLGNGASRDYRRGLLGPPLWEGGDGTAEECYLETVGHVIDRFRRLADFAWDRTRWSLLVTYVPYPDEAFHLWLGFLDPNVPGHDPELARRLRPYVDRSLGLVDDYLAHLLERLGPDDVLAIGSDHGQIGSARAILPNRILARAGLVFATDDGAVDLARTRVLYHPGNSGRVVANRDERPGGTLSAEQAAEALRLAARALRDARDPETGGPLFSEVREEGDSLMLVAAPGYYASSALDGEPVEPRSPGGVHLFGPRRERMHASFLVWGAGVAGGTDLGVIDQVDVAPTLAALLGLDPPAQADGGVLENALVEPWAR